MEILDKYGFDVGTLNDNFMKIFSYNKNFKNPSMIVSIDTLEDKDIFFNDSIKTYQPNSRVIAFTKCGMGIFYKPKGKFVGRKKQPQLTLRYEIGPLIGFYKDKHLQIVVPEKHLLIVDYDNYRAKLIGPKSDCLWVKMDEKKVDAYMEKRLNFINNFFNRVGVKGRYRFKKN